MFQWMMGRTEQTALARTMALQTLVAAEMFYLLCISRFIPTLWGKLRGRSESLAYASAIGIACLMILQVMFSQLGIFNRLFNNVPLS